MNLGTSKNTLREQEAAYAAAGAKQDHALVRELWAIEKMFKDIEKFDRQSIPDALRVLNLGELGDPLAVDDITGFSEQLLPYSMWEKDYHRLTEMIFDHVEPSMVTIGEYRPAQGLSSHIKTRFPESFLLKVNGSLIAEAGKLRYPREFRIEMFHTIADGIRRCDKKVRIALCKETPQIWKAVGLEGKELFCNCTN